MLQDALLGWYDAHARDLPWRRSRDPYAVLVSEFMLQQTQVSRVIPRFDTWLAQWPDEHALAAATVGDVLRAWVGLGYNRRALRLHACAQQLARDGWPKDAAGLRALPGVGAYTAAAVATFAFGERVAAVDVNHTRVVTRVLGITAESPRVVAAAAQALIPADRPDAYNHAVMDLGATVCRARTADCGVCPLRDRCVSVNTAIVEPARPGPGHARPRFEDTDRYVRGQIVRALAEGRELPTTIASARLDRALASLATDGLVVRRPEGWSLP